MSQITSKGWFPFLVLLVAPAFFSTNLIFGRYVAPEVNPFVLAFLRWLSVAILLFPFAYRADGRAMLSTMRKHWLFFLFLAYLGMGISGSGVYLGLQSTTATNATLIYSTTPILIILLERIFSNRKSNFREMIGISIALIGVAVIVLNGELATIVSLSFNRGDIFILLASLSWAGYSILYRSERVSHLKSISLFGIIAIYGALINLPMATYELACGAGLPSSRSALFALAGIIFISSLLAFSAFQYGVRALGASVAGLFMYLMTPYGVLMAVVFLGERLEPFHIFGIIAVMAGIGLATFPKSVLIRLASGFKSR